ncbi:RNA polymerase III subunit Rpc25-domain-containing protein [Tuber borchii]|uniref:DNA-directed RNA polymerase subunit n=1 Tax=Tuber borchii TaxID=42251 RepID=A0A2T7A368_TUBBO|nr:RNA polymerase III subunit Rpc25-domain-containing protein [Tuber borchii]
MIGQDGGAHVNVEFRMIVFRPFKGEVLTGRISSATAAGVKVRTDFFDEIFIPAGALFEGSRFDGKEQVWIWRDDGQDFYMDKNELIRFRVEGEVFVDQLPVPPHLKGEESSLHNKPPYAITASCQQAGLGLVSWWVEEEEVEEKEEGE